jgi:hypothetical protein
LTPGSNKWDDSPMSFYSKACRHLVGVLVFFAFLLSGGCAYHRVGWNHATRRIVHAAPIVNRSGNAGISGILWQRLIQEINMRPGFASGPASDAEWILDVSIGGFSQGIGTTSPENSDTVRSYTLTLSGTCAVSEKSTGREIMPVQTVHAAVTLPTHPSYTEAKRQAASQISGILAGKICDLLSSAWDFSTESAANVVGK